MNDTPLGFNNANCIKSNSDLPFLSKHTFIIKRHYYVIFQSFKENVFALKVSHVVYRISRAQPDWAFRMSTMKPKLFGIQIP